MLTSAYLEAFRLRGYWYILNSNLDPIRSQILSTQPGALVDSAVREWDMGAPRKGILRLVSRPSAAQCFAFSMFGKTALLPKAEDRAGHVYDSLRTHLAPPFKEFHLIDPRVRGGRVDLSMGLSGTRRLATFAHPDVGTVRRLDPALPSNLDWIKAAPPWAAPLVTP